MKTRKIDMTQGSIGGKMFQFAMPVMFSNLLQLVFFAADLIVIGHYASRESMAAVGAAGSINAVLVNTFVCICMGANVVAARFFGAKDRRKLQRTVHTAMLMSFLLGGLIMISAFALLNPMLRWQSPPAEVLPKTRLYLMILFCGIPFSMVYNFGCAILRGMGDTVRPLIYLTISGILNVALNLLLVIQFGMDVGGIAIATTFSLGVAAFLVLRALLKARDDSRLYWKMLAIDWKIFWEILRIGVPTCLQGACFSLSNLIIQSSINTFGSAAMAGSAAAVNFEAFIWMCTNAFHLAILSFVAQNYGARDFGRIQRSFKVGSVFVFSISAVLGLLLFAFAGPLTGLFNPDPEVVKWGVLRAEFLMTTYFLCAAMDAYGCMLRGLGYSMTAMFSSLSGACFFRIFWVYCIFPLSPTMKNLLYSYPISWGLVAAFNAILLYRFIWPRLLKKHHVTKEQLA